MSTLDLEPDDPLVVHLSDVSGVVDLDKLRLESPAVRRMIHGGLELVVPLTNQGEVIGMLSLGPRRSRQPYTAGDRAFLTGLATQMAPAVRVAQMVRQRQAEAQARERMDQELWVARLIQQTLLPQTLPDLPGWRLATDYRPARAVGGDFYDFLDLADGRLALIIGDVTSKGVPAALVMATTRSVLRATALQLPSPGQILGRANELLCPDMPAHMFVTCFYAVLEPATGQLAYANAGHPLPLRRGDCGVDELRATGMPLGLMFDARYEEREIRLAPGESVVFYSDGLVEAHDRRNEMLGLPRLRQLVADYPKNELHLLDYLIAEFTRFTGADWESEDDVTLVTLRRETLGEHGEEIDGVGWRTLAEWSLASEPGNERLAKERVAAEIHSLGLPPGRVERLKTAVAEATLNAMEHGNGYRSRDPVHLEVRTSETGLSVLITAHGAGPPATNLGPPNLEAKLANSESPRGWGLFLIKHMVDDMHVTSDGIRHTIELVLQLEGAGDVGHQA
jgi:serine phosphatase RsbU (regulator of sigma subunit)/anti-sigma regulatory factor (Ser/Thr protein kinase)